MKLLLSLTPLLLLSQPLHAEHMGLRKTAPRRTVKNRPARQSYASELKALADSLQKILPRAKETTGEPFLLFGKFQGRSVIYAIDSKNDFYYADVEKAELDAKRNDKVGVHFSLPGGFDVTHYINGGKGDAIMEGQMKRIRDTTDGAVEGLSEAFALQLGSWIENLPPNSIKDRAALIKDLEACSRAVGKYSTRVDPHIARLKSQ